MQNWRKSVWKPIFYLTCCELLVTILCTFVVLSEAEYRSRKAFRTILGSMHALTRTRSLHGASIDGFLLALWLASTACFAAMIILILLFSTWIKGIFGSKDIYSQPAEKASPSSYEIPSDQVSGQGIASVLWHGTSIACVLLAIASFLLYTASLIGYVLSPVVYFVIFIFAFALGVGSGFGSISKSGSSRTQSNKWLGRFKAAPHWMQLAIIMTGAILVFACTKTGYGALTHPSLYNTATGSTNLAAVGSFLFFVDALSFRPV